jgi:ATP-dependent Clp protease protease subunit
MNEVKNIGIPVVVTRDSDGNTLHQDIYSRLLKDRIIMIDGEIEPHMASVVVAELLYLQAEDPTAPINMYIASPGGSCNAGLSIISTMNLITNPVYVTAHGCIASMGSVITSAGEKGHRYILPYTRVMLHQASSGGSGNVQDLRISLKETEDINEILLKILADNCGKTYEEMKKETERDHWLSDEEAVKFGLVDEILTKK